MDIERAWDGIVGKRLEYDTLWAYYDGEHPLVYSASRLTEIFKNIDANFSENWCAVVVDSVLERMHIERWGALDGASETAANEMWDSTQLNIDADHAHLQALVTGEGFVVVGQEEDGAIDAYVVDSRMMHVEYEADRPKVMRFAAKLWQDTNGYYRMRLYYDDVTEDWTTTAKTMPQSAKAFVLSQETANGSMQIPVFHLRRDRRVISSELKNVINPQAQLNKLLADMMVTGEFSAFPQRYLITQNAADTQLKNAPNLIWQIPAGDGIGQPVSVGELPATDLGKYLEPIERAANVIAALSRTPKHYFFSTGEAPSGEALLTMEAPLVKKATKYMRRLEPVWRACMAYMVGLRLDRPGRATEYDAIWAPAASSLPATNAQIVKTSVEAGIPLATALRRLGWTEEEIGQMEQDRQAEQASQATLADALMVQAQARFDREDGRVTGER